ncbi:MAG TPA: hypothetical protein VIY48_07390 [Candidatus Paceibacterota bacterium]|jgi:hypothetical protein
MIVVDNSVFPNNAVEILATAFIEIDADLSIFKRPLRREDPIQSVGVFAQQWYPQEESYEMRGTPQGQHEPTLQNYYLGIQAFVKDAEEVRGLAVHSVLTKRIRTMLYRDNPLRIGLVSLVDVSNGMTERTNRFGIRSVRYVSNEIGGQWLYLSTTEFWLETETV